MPQTRQMGDETGDIELFPLSPEAVRRLRGAETEAQASLGFARCDDQTTTHGDNLLRELRRG